MMDGYREPTVMGVQDLLTHWKKPRVIDGVLYRVVNDPTENKVRQKVWPKILRHTSLEINICLCPFLGYV